jgi:hypothetical protein
VKQSLFLFTAIIILNLVQAQDKRDSASIQTTFVEEHEEQKDFSGPNDSSVITKRSFDNNHVDKLKADPSLNYKVPPTVAESLWDRFLAWLGEFLESLFRSARTTSIGQFLVYLGGIILIIFIIMLLLKVDALKVFYSGADKGKTGYKIFHENIHEMDFERLIREANEKGEYRLGVRLIFLYALKTLSDKQLIEWQAGKTNHDYVEELNVKELKTGLNELSFYFDYAWYGGFSIDKTIFSKVESVFKSWKDNVK